MLSSRLRTLGLFLLGLAWPLVSCFAAETEKPETWFAPVTAERIAKLPSAQQPAWRDYLTQSDKLAAADRAFLAAEAKAANQTEPKLAPYATVFGVKLDQPVEWFATPEGRRITAIIVSYQTPAGGWSKRIDLGKAPRPVGGDFVTEHTGSYEGTFDNDATSTQLAALAKAVKATGDEKAKASFLRGLHYVFIAQYPNGGWPQVYPLEGGYHDAITYNDGVIVNLLDFLHDVAAGENEYAFVPTEVRAEARQRYARGIDCILASQIKVGGQLTVWCQQHDAITLAACGARNFEPASLCAGESAGLMRFLIELPQPSPAAVAAVHGAAAWFEATAIHGYVWKYSGPDGRRLIAVPGAKDLWARLYEPITNRPIFGDRDRTIHYDVAEISKERRNGYAWYGDWPSRQLQHYARWSKAHPAK